MTMQPEPESLPLREGLLIRASELAWSPLGPGTWYKLLRACEATGAFTVFLRVEAGAFFLAHRHLGAADFFVLQGSVEYVGGVAQAGDWVYEPAGAVHPLTVCPEETVVLFHFHGPVALLAPDQSVLMRIDAAFVRSQAAAQAAGAAISLDVSRTRVGS